MKENPIITSPWTRISHSPEETAELANELAGLFAPKGLVMLSGDLGSGKTTLTQDLLKAWGYKGSVKSPTFDLVHVYPLPAFTVYHADLYRLQGDDGLDILDLPSPHDAHSIIIAEWGEALRSLYPEGFALSLEACGENCRQVELTAYGPGAQQRLQQWRTSQSLKRRS
ncbi:MAG: tRNA (adenosine(37)-N6)-threonylcarbamoyltransferase complex ATPase subunit type 1 TsaE [Sulfobacillus thermosulfidooxidans]|uniref:tRNA threonylcarbamoyladenosine biosynthesis protein TsaE n=1 Tax=Sulfobacillus thermotolerans TaxID=338644 RepID=A0ABM6RRL1_9FIRM|nr:tRNA (adenosine(37)-N6)-threonylcarbamoyltransferase complex ATPase subunit type 1 TsaE [Sulfobacillus thermotolerans]MCY0907612.1 tRNA (adenosine(37)-N6)-threonylcarbamoyltransferase complex ATPase subunit type 1 TsaE [Sulfobacillus thermotolerans]PSR37096.1 MAG: tRNA (adenosine(37)-N6)-threonylcarbamoyltransferase complex ATPase subunit type 1 TsaE [Sulfobacillus thermosulfidooxidans]